MPTPEHLQLNTPDTSPDKEQEISNIKQRIEQIKNRVREIRPLLDDTGVSRDIIDEAKALGEEFYAKTKELERLERNYTECIINGTKVELGPTLERIAWNDIQSKLDEINKSLKQGEKPWRVPAKEEFIEIGKPLREIWEDKKLSDQQKKEKAKSYVEALVFAWDSDYWCSTEDAGSPGYAWSWFSNSGYMGTYYKNNKYLVRLVR
jgi:hypothetical protein